MNQEATRESAAAEDLPETNFPGLTSAEVEQSRQQHGWNVLTPPERDPWWKLYLEKFADPVIRILMIAAFIAIAVGIADQSYVEGVGILIAILLATTLAFLNEYKANREFEVLNQVSDEQPVKVIRERRYKVVPRKEIVVGDVMFLEVGEEIPADGTVLEAVSLQVDESRLTGEAHPVNKVVKASPEDQEHSRTAYPANFVLRSSMTVDGHGLVQVSAVGDETEIGKTARAAAEETEGETPLNRQLSKLSQLIGVIGFAVALGAFIALSVRGVMLEEIVLNSTQWYVALLGAACLAIALVRVWLPIAYDAMEVSNKEVDRPDWLEEESIKGWLIWIVAGALLFGVGIGGGIAAGWISSTPGEWLPRDAVQEFLHYFMIAVTIIVVAVPEGLAMSVTLSLAYSMRKMMAENNLVRRMHACETIGAATVICSDKTGTLTQNKMRVTETHLPVLNGKEPSSNLKSIPERLLVEAIAANSTAQLSFENEEVAPLGNPTEGALLIWLHELGIDFNRHRQKFDILKQWTFTTERKSMGILGRSPVKNQVLLYMKGAPELLLSKCDWIAVGEQNNPLDEAQRKSIRQEIKDLQSRGMRVLGLAYKEASEADAETDYDLVSQKLIWLGFLSLSDPVRPEVPAAIQACRKAGVGVKVVTGDSVETGVEIARQIGLWTAEDTATHAMTGSDFNSLSDEEAAERIPGLKVMARARPTDKMRLVRMLREKGDVVAVTGDGVNDAPALNHADVGLAMGKTGTAVAREASDIILLDDSFKSIANAIQWGRSLYENIQRFLLFQLTINVAALAIAFLGPFLGVKFPLTVIQMLWVNLIMDTFAALALATEPPHPEVMQRPPRDPKAFIITKPMGTSIMGTGWLFVLIMISLMFYLKSHDAAWDQKIGVESSIFFTVFVLLQFWNLFNARALGWNRSAFAGLGENKAFLAVAAAILIGQILIVQFGGEVFRTVPLSLKTWLILLASTSVVVWAGEIWRLMQKQKTAPAHS